MLKKINPGILIVLVLMLILNYTDGRFSNPREWLLNLVIMLPGIIIGLSFHEFAHGYVSHLLGDPTPKAQGRLTLNPLAHVDPIGFIALMFCGFGWGIPVEINPIYYKHRRRDELLVSLAGVVMNLLLAVAASFVLKILISTNVYTSTMGDILVQIFVQIAIINLVLMVFNLIPVPPLDGFGIITQIFDLRKYDWYYKVYNNGMWILLALIVFNVTDMILSPAVNGIWQLLCRLIIY